MRTSTLYNSSRFENYGVSAWAETAWTYCGQGRGINSCRNGALLIFWSSKVNAGGRRRLIMVVQSPLLLQVIGRNGEATFPRSDHLVTSIVCEFGSNGETSRPNQQRQGGRRRIHQWSAILKNFFQRAKITHFRRISAKILRMKHSKLVHYYHGHRQRRALPS